jgi:hypothetical protein
MKQQHLEKILALSIATPPGNTQAIVNMQQKANILLKGGDKAASVMRELDNS